MPNNDATTLGVITGIDVRTYWLSSRFVVANSYIAYFGVRVVNSGENNVFGDGLFISDGDYDKHRYPVRAVVTIPASFLVEHAGTKSNPHIIQP